MRRLFVVLFLGVFTMSFGVSDAMAIGLGGYLGYAGGSTSLDVEDEDGVTWDRDADEDMLNIGFVLDTAVSGDSVLNYRLNLGYTNVSATTDEDWDYSLDGFQLINTLGIAIVKNKKVRIWAGPQLGFTSLYGGADDYDWNLEFFGLIIGPVVGVNFHVNEKLSVGVDAGYRYIALWGEGWDPDWYANDEEYEGDGSFGFINVSLLFKLNE